MFKNDNAPENDSAPTVVLCPVIMVKKKAKEADRRQPVISNRDLNHFVCLLCVTVREKQKHVLFIEKEHGCYCEW